MRMGSADRVAESFARIRLAPSVVKPKKKKVAGPVNSGRPALPKCTLKYALALTDPFHLSARGACVPIGAAQTMKTHMFTRFDITIGTAGTAMLYLIPSVAADLPSVVFTNSSWAGTQYNPFSSSGVLGAAGTASGLNPGWQYTGVSGPISSTQLLVSGVPGFSPSQQVSGKLVSAGVRAQYTGTTLNESGLYYCYTDPAHSNLSGISQAQIGTFADANIEGVSRKPCMLTTFAVTSGEMTFPLQGGIGENPGRIIDLLYPYSQRDATWSSVFPSGTPFVGCLVGAGGYGFPIGAPSSVMFITGVAGQTVHIEYIAHVEYQGEAAASMLTPTTADIQGAEMVQTAALALPQMKLAEPRKTAWELMYSALGAAWKEVKPFVVPIAEAALMTALA